MMNNYKYFETNEKIKHLSREMEHTKEKLIEILELNK